MLKSFKYYRPKTQAEALDLLADPDIQAVPLVIRPKPDNPRRIGAGAFVDLSLLDLDYIRASPDGSLRIGALTTLQEILDSRELKRGALNLLSMAAELVAGPGIRNLSSLWGAVEALNGPPELILALLALDAEITLLSTDRGTRTIPFHKFSLSGEEAVRKGEMVIEACISLGAERFGWALERVARTPRDEAIVAAAAVIEIHENTAGRVSLALAGANPVPLRLPAVEKLLSGTACDSQILHAAGEVVMEKAKPVADFRGGGDYRRAMAGLVVQRALRKAWQSADDHENRK